MTRRAKLGAAAVLLVLAMVVALVAWLAWQRAGTPEEQAAAPGRGGAVAVEVAPIERGTIRDERTFSGTLDAGARFTVAPKVGGRVQRMAVDVGDEIERGQVLATLDDDEFAQAVAQAEAELAVTEAELVRARNELALAEREFERVQSLRERGVASDAQLDEVATTLASRRGAVAVAEAQVQRARAGLQAARIRLGYTRVVADWEEGDVRRAVAERFIDAGDTVSANDPIVSVVRLDPLRAVIRVTERDYGRLAAGQVAHLRTDAFPGRDFPAQVVRLAPVFRETSRQARVELQVPNADLRLRPGMFVRVNVVLDEAPGATLVPREAVVRRDGREVVFVVSPEGDSVREVPVAVGIVQGGRVQVAGEGVDGLDGEQVVVLGQQLLRDGAAVTIPQITGSAADRAAGGAGE